ncbi:MAG: sulfurtransferase [Hyphomicrobiales bacterium]|nr:sulfurtransferase [Hyphomicrobiales bacterium]
MNNPVQKSAKATLFAAVLAVATVVAALVPPTAARALNVPRPLVDVDWLDANRDDVVVIDVRKDPATFTKTGHIPGARVVQSKALRMTRELYGAKYAKMRPTRAHFQALMRDLGVNRDSAVVLTNRGEKASQVVHATLLYWQLKYFGFDNVAILDGGNAAWEAALMDMSDEPMGPVAAGDFVAAEPRENLVATLTDVEETVTYGGPQLVDTRELNYYLGLKKKSYVDAAGHIPNAVVLPYAFLTADEGPAFFRPPMEQVELARYMGLKPRDSMIVYCNSGNLATANWFVMHELVGNMDVRLYDGSMLQWTQNGKHVVTRHIN